MLTGTGAMVGMVWMKVSMCAYTMARLGACLLVTYAGGIGTEQQGYYASDCTHGTLWTEPVGLEIEMFRSDNGDAQVMLPVMLLAVSSIVLTRVGWKVQEIGISHPGATRL